MFWRCTKCNAWIRTDDTIHVVIDTKNEHGRGGGGGGGGSTDNTRTQKCSCIIRLTGGQVLFIYISLHKDILWVLIRSSLARHF